MQAVSCRRVGGYRSGHAPPPCGLSGISGDLFVLIRDYDDELAGGCLQVQWATQPWKRGGSRGRRSGEGRGGGGLHGASSRRLEGHDSLELALGVLAHRAVHLGVLRGASRTRG